MTWTETSTRNSMAVLALAILCIAACGPNAPAAAQGTSTPAAQFLSGNGTKWQQIIKDAKVSDITGVALDGRGDIYLAELSANRVAEYSINGKFIMAFGTHGSGPGQLSSPGKVAIDSQGNVYVTDIDNNRVQKFSATGQPLAQWGGLDASSDPGKFNFPIGMAVDSEGNVFVVDAYNYRIQKLSPQGLPLAQWSSQGTEPLPLRLPYDITLDAKGHIYVSYVHGNDGVEEFSTAGADVGPLGGFGSDLGVFNTPTGIVVDGAGNVYVLDAGNNRIQELSSSGKYVAQWAGPTTRTFFMHSELTMDGAGNAYVSDGNALLKLCLNTAGCR